MEEVFTQLGLVFKEYIDCMPNPFDCYRLRKLGFDINFYRTI